MLKQVITVLNYKGAKLTEQNIKEVLGRSWAWKMGKLMKVGGFVEDEWQSEEVRQAIAEHNQKVWTAWIVGGGDPKRHYWWHVTEITLDNLRPSPKWKQENEDLKLAKECEALVQRGLTKAANEKRNRDEKMRMLREVAELFKTDWPKLEGRPPP